MPTTGISAGMALPISAASVGRARRPSDPSPAQPRRALTFININPVTREETHISAISGPKKFLPVLLKTAAIAMRGQRCNICTSSAESASSHRRLSHSERPRAALGVNVPSSHLESSVYAVTSRIS